MNRVEVLDKVGPLIDGEVRNIKDAGGVKVYAEPGGVTTLRPRRGMQTMEMEPDAVKGMVSFVGMPLRVAQQLSGNTFSQVLSELLDHTGQYSLMVRDDKITSVLKYGARSNVNPEKLLDITEKVVPGIEYHRCMVTPENRTATLEIVGEKQAPVKARGDLVRAGVSLSFSPMGTIEPVVQSYAVVLSCTNGQTSNVVLNSFGHHGGGGGGGRGGGEGDDIWKFFRQSIRKAYGSFDKVMSGWRKLIDENIPEDQRAAVLTALIRRAKLRPDIAESVRAMAITHPPTNAWEMQNLITYASSHLLTQPAQVQRAQRAAAEFADETTHAMSCPLCHRTN